MTIAEARLKCKALLAKVPKDGLVLGLLLLSSSASFGLGFLTGSERSAGQGIGFQTSLPEEAPAAAAAALTSGPIVASKNGTKYYFTGCAGASRISAKNKVYFASVASAESAGYQLASGCKAP